MSAPLSEQQLAEIRARAEAATAGPWCTDGWEIYQGEAEDVPNLAKWIGETCRADDHNGSCSDAAFIAASRSDVPTLVAEVERLRAEAVRLQAVADREHKAFVDTHSALNLLAQDAQRVMAENGVQAQQAELVRVREQAAKFKEQRGEWARKARAAEARAAELEAAPLAWAEKLDAKSLDNLLITLSQAADYEPVSGAIAEIHEVLAGFRKAAETQAATTAEVPHAAPCRYPSSPECTCKAVAS